MAYVLFDPTTRTVRAAVCGPAPDTPPAGLSIGLVGDDIGLEGAIQNYVFVADASRDASEPLPHGRLRRKPEAEWDLDAEQRELEQRRISQRFHKLDMGEVRRIEVYLLVPSRFERLRERAVRIKVLVDDITVDLALDRPDPLAFEPGLPFGGSTLFFTRTLVRLELTGHELFLMAALDKSLAGLDEQARRLFTSQHLRRECLLFAVRATNRLIDAYRVAHNDPWERPIGMADVLDGAVVIELMDGPRMSSLSGISLPSLNTLSDKDAATAVEVLRHLAALPAIPFDSIAMMELRKAHLYGQYRECIVWAGTLIGNAIDAVLLNALPKDSAPYKRLKNCGDKVRGATRRGEYFKQATGETLEEKLKAVEAKHPWARGLADNVENVLNTRNRLLHRRKAIRAEEAQLAYETCMMFLTAIGIGVPFVPNEDRTDHL